MKISKEFRGEQTMSWYRYGGFPPYVSVAERKRKAAKKIAALKKKGQSVEPVIIKGRMIARTFWGKAWCDHLESYSDYANRLPRGRTYVRNGSVIDLKVNPGEIKALVHGSSLYKVNISISAVDENRWNTVISDCAGKIDSLIELLQGKFSKNVMEIIAHRDKGLFPHPKEVKLKCSCPDWADMCKHVAAVLYGIGARLDESPEDLFLLRQVDHLRLIEKVSTKSIITSSSDQMDVFLEGDLSTLFGIDIDATPKINPPQDLSGMLSASKKKVTSKKSTSPKTPKLKKSKAKTNTKPKSGG